MREHPHSGRKHLFLGRRPFAYIPGLSLDESEDLLDLLWRQLDNDANCWSQQWQAGDLIFWDNRYTTHRRDAVGSQSRRVMHRKQLAASA